MLLHQHKCTTCAVNLKGELPAMEAAIVSASTGVMRSLLAKLTNLLGGEYKLLKWLRREMEFLESELRSMSIFLERLEDTQKLHPQMKDWRDRVRESTRVGIRH